MLEKYDEVDSGKRVTRQYEEQLRWRREKTNGITDISRFDQSSA